MTDWQYYPAIFFGAKDKETLDVGGVEMVRTDDGIHYPVDLLARKAHLFERVGVYDHHRSFGDGPMNRPQRVGRVVHVVWNSRCCEICGVLEIHSPPIQRWLEALAPDELPGLSPVLYNIKRGPKGAQLVEDIKAVESLDFSSDPLSGARILPVSEAVDIMALVEAKRLGYHFGREATRPTRKRRGLTQEQRGIIALALAKGIAALQGISQQGRQLDQERKEIIALALAERIAASRGIPQRAILHEDLNFRNPRIRRA